MDQEKICRILLQKIISGELSPGDRIAPEPVLSYWDNGVNASQYLFKGSKFNIRQYGAHGKSMNAIYLDGHVQNTARAYRHSSSGGADLWNIALEGNYDILQ